jgi:branched-chain amino acid transport system ATP-binding protein
MTASTQTPTRRHDPASGQAVLEAKDVAVHFGGVKAVDGISMTLMPGLIYGIIGPNGSGKSTLIGAITRLTKLTSGKLLFDGEEYQGVPASAVARKRVARTFQTVRLLPDLNVKDNIQLGADARADGDGQPLVRRLLNRTTSPVVAEVIERTNLRGFESFFPSELSYGTQRRVEIARAMVTDPRLLLLDEPTAGMNQKERAEISGLLQDLRSEGLCQLLVEHDVQMMIDTCDHVFAMNFGKLIAEGRPEDVVRDPQVQEAYLGRKWREHA